MNNSSEVSLIEQQFWLLSQQKNASAYNVTSLFITENLDLEKFIGCLNQVINSYSIFRSSYHSENGKIYRTDTHSRCHLVERIIYSNEEDFLHQAKDWVLTECYKNINLEQEPPVRLIVAKNSNSPVNVIALVFHHIIIDFHAKDLFFQLISSLYNSKKSTLDVKDNYQQFTDWQKGWLSSENADEAAAYWIDKLKSVNSAKIEHLPGTPKNLIDKSSVKNQAVDISSKQWQDILHHCSQRTISPFIFLLSAYYILIAKYSNENKFCVAVPLSNRKHSEFKNTMGCFVNTMPITIDLSEDDNVSCVLKKVRRTLLEAHRYQDYPCIKIIKNYQKAHISKHLYSHGFTFEPPVHLNLESVNTDGLILQPQKPQLDIFLRLWINDNGLNGGFEFNDELFDHEFICRFTKSYKQILKAMVKDEYKLIASLDFIPASEQIKLEEFNHTHQSFDAPMDLKSLFEQQVKRTPDARALFCSDEELTYAEFNSRANKLANYLLKNNIKKNDVIGVLSERSIDMMVIIYAVIKVGATYLPIDIDLPQQRVRYMLSQADAKIVISKDGKCYNFELPDIEIICLETICETLNLCDINNPVTHIEPTQLAYVIFTSGSTGNPKGVMNSHRAVANRLLWMQEEFNANASDVILQKTPYSFDVSVWEIFWPLQVGASLAIAEHGSHKNAYLIHEQINRYKVSIIHFVPAMLNSFLKAHEDYPKSLRYLVSSGEALTSELVDSFYERFPDSELINLYGPTEAAVDVSIWRCDKNYKNKTIPIGKPIANTALYVVNQSLQQVPIGVTGELLIGGIQVADGYIGDEQLTRQQFIANPFAKGRVYKTGDFARWTESGDIEFLGRKDHQIKINGIRIELAEIENAINRYPNIFLSAALLEEKSEERKAIIAFYEIKNKAEKIEVNKLKLFMFNTLPSHMVPAEFYELESIPLTPNGKVNKNRLQGLSRFLSTNSDKNYEHRTATEANIHEAWRMVLGDRQYTLDMTFFELGGDSLTLMQVYEILHQQYPDRLNSVDMFSFPTIRTLAAHLDNKQNAHQKTDDFKQRANRMRAVLQSRKNK